MYKVEIDGQTLYHPNLQSYFIENALLSLEVNKAGTFKFTIRPNNPVYSNIKIMESRVVVYDDDEIVFAGRVLNTKRGMYNEKQVTCEGELACLLDTVIRPYEYSGTVGDYFAWLFNQHRENAYSNLQDLRAGRCTVTNNNNNIFRSNKNYPTTFNELKEKLLDSLGGYISLRHEDGVTYVDYLQDFETENEQVIEFGKNLTDLEDLIKGQDIATSIIPLGAYLKDEDGNDTDERLTIAYAQGFHGADDITDPDMSNKIGKITKVVVFEDVTTVEYLEQKGREELANALNFLRSLKLTAIDLHLLNQDIRKFKVESYVRVKSGVHNLDERLIVRKMEINITNPAEGHIEIGEENKTLSATMARQAVMNKLAGKYKGVWKY